MCTPGKRKLMRYKKESLIDILLNTESLVKASEDLIEPLQAEIDSLISENKTCKFANRAYLYGVLILIIMLAVCIYEQ